MSTVLDAPAPPTIVRTSAAPHGPAARRWTIAVAGLASVLAGAIHLGAAPATGQAWPLEGIAFVIVGIVQAGAGLWLLVGRRRPTVAWAVTAVHLAAITTWAVTRTLGWPVGEFAGQVEPVDAADLVAALAALVAVVALRRAGPARLARTHRWTLGGAAVGLLGIVGPVVAVVPALSHDAVAHEHGAVLPADERADGLDLRRNAGMPTDGTSVAVGDGPVDIAFGHGLLWVANGRDGTVTRLRPDGQLVDTIVGVGDGPTSVAIGPDATWVASAGGTVARLDPDTGRVTNRVEVGGLARGVAVGPDGAVYATSAADGTLSRIDPDTLQVRTAPTLPDVHPAFNGPGPADVTVDGDVVWVVHTLRRELVRFDARTLEPVGDPVGTGGGATEVLLAGDVVWVPATTAGTVWRHDRLTGERVGDPILLDTRPEYGGGPASVTAAFGSLWVLNNDERTVTRVDLVTGTVLGEPFFLANRHAEVPRGVGIIGTGDAVWATDHDADRIVRLTP